MGSSLGPSSLGAGNGGPGEGGDCAEKKGRPALVILREASQQRRSAQLGVAGSHCCALGLAAVSGPWELPGLPRLCVASLSRVAICPQNRGSPHFWGSCSRTGKSGRGSCPILCKRIMAHPTPEARTVNHALGQERKPCSAGPSPGMTQQPHAGKWKKLANNPKPSKGASCQRLSNGQQGKIYTSLKLEKKLSPRPADLLFFHSVPSELS